MDNLQVGVVGCGYWGPKLARNFHEIPEAELGWVCDLSQERLEHVSSLYPQVRATRDFEELLDSSVEALAIATPVSTHHALALRALRAGKHILVEKPLAADSAEAQEIVDEAAERDLVVMVGHTFEYNAAVQAVKELIASGELGEVYYINGTRVNLGLFQPDINVVWDLAPHDVSILRYILDQDPEAASARGGVYVQRQRRIHDVAYLTFYFPRGVLADVRVSWLDPCKIRQYTVVGSKKMLVYDDIAPDKVVLYDKGVEIPPYSDTVAEFHLSYRSNGAEAVPIEWREPLRTECQHFAHSVRNGSQPQSNGAVGLKVVKALEAANRSLLNGGAREVIQW